MELPRGSRGVADYINEEPAALRRGLAALPARCDDLAAQWGSPRRVHLVGSGTSGYAARSAWSTWPRAVVPVEIHEPFELMQFDSDLISAADVVVAVSQSGTSVQTLASLELARGRGAAALLVTGDRTETGATGASLLNIEVGPEAVGAKTKGYLGSVLALQLLGHALTQDGGATCAARLLGPVPQAAADVIAQARAHVTQFARAVATAPVLQILAYGSSMGAAEEGALKLREMARVAVEVCEVEEYVHGPHRCLTDKSAVIALAPPGPGQDRMGEVMEVVAGVTDRTWMITHGGGALARDGRHPRSLILDVPAELPAEASALLYPIPLQLLAVELAAVRGWRPEDDPFPGLSERLATKHKVP